MPTPPVNTHLTPIAPSVSTSAGAPTSILSPPTSNGSVGSTSQNLTNNVPTSTTANNASNSASLTTGTNPQTRRRLPWRKIQRVCTLIAKLIFAAAGTIMAYLALSTAMWSSAKDYRDDCRSQKVKIPTLPPNSCTNISGRKPTGASHELALKFSMRYFRAH